MPDASQDFPSTIPDLLERAAADFDLIACAERNKAGNWIKYNWKQFSEEINAAAHALNHIGLAAGDRLAILAPSSRTWQTLELAAQSLGIVTVGIDPLLPSSSMQSVLQQTRPKTLISDCEARLDALPPENQIPAYTIHQLNRFHAPASPRTSIQVNADDPATIIFTSGTSGEPKGVQFTHRQILLACRAIRTAFDVPQPGDSTLCWLPMAHLFQRMINLVAISCGATIYFCPDPLQAVECAQQVRPTVMIGVPRFYEKLHDSIAAHIRNQSGLRGRLARWGLGVARKAGAIRRNHGRLPMLIRAQQFTAEQLVLRRIRSVLGGKIRFMITGSAPISPALIESFADLGWTVYEAYACTENSVPIAANRPGQSKTGSVGQPLDENEVRLSGDGEVLVRGPGLFDGYLGDTGDTSYPPLSPDGFYHTGDLGYFDDDGMLHLTGRKSDVFKTSTGRKIAPARIEAIFQQSPLLDSVIVIGSGRKHLVALAWPNWPAVQQWLKEENRLTESEPERMAALDEVQRLIQSEFDVLGADLSPYERPAGISIQARRLTMEDGELTANLKLRRHRIEDNRAADVERLYSSWANHGSPVNVAPIAEATTG